MLTYNQNMLKNQEILTQDNIINIPIIDQVIPHDSMQWLSSWSAIGNLKLMSRFVYYQVFIHE